MNGGEKRNISIFEPFEQAFALTRRILFQPFDLGKWCIIGFAAFLAGLSDGTHFGSSFNFNTRGGDGHFNWSFKTFSGDATTAAGMDHMVWWLAATVLVCFGVALLVLIVVAAWAGSRGRFIFIDCIVRNRAAIARPWKEYAREGNSLFVFLIVSGLAWLLIIALAALPVIFPWWRNGEAPELGAALLVYLIAAGSFFAVALAAWALSVWFMVPVMYRQRCGPIAALGQVWQLIVSAPLTFLLYTLFVIVVVIGGAMLSCLVTCVTCCIAAIPYVGTVILLPLYTFYYAYTLLFLRQFGAEYDVWANLAADGSEVSIAATIVPPPLPC